MPKGSPRKSQIHEPNFKIWNYRGTNSFINFNPVKILTSDAWLCTDDILLDNFNLTIRRSDLVVALLDNPGELTANSIQSGKWKIIRHLSDDDIHNILNITAYQQLRYTNELMIVTSGESQNYNPVTKHLSIGTTLQSGDNVNLYLNGLKYSYLGQNNAFDFAPGMNVLVWIPTNIGFDLTDGEYIEIEIFNNE